MAVRSNNVARYCLLLNSCDSYQDTWAPFFDLLQKYWKDVNCNIYLNTESCDFNDSKYSFKVNVLNNGHKTRWGGRLRACLDQIEEEYILMTLDDYFICSDINEECIDKLVDKMEEDKSIASFQLIASRYNATGITVADCLVEEGVTLHEVGRDGNKVHFVPTIWRKSVLKKWLRNHESIWGFEAYGKRRASFWNYKEKVYEVIAPVIYDYLWTSTCCSAIVNGKWMVAPEVDAFFEKNGIEVDMNKRGRITLEEYSSHDMNYVLSQLTLGELIIKTIWRIRSFW